MRKNLCKQAGNLTFKFCVAYTKNFHFNRTKSLSMENGTKRERGNFKDGKLKMVYKHKLNSLKPAAACGCDGWKCLNKRNEHKKFLPFNRHVKFI